jgi:transposase
MRSLEQYHLRAGVEGLVSQAVNSHGLRRSRCRGLAKTRLQHLATAAALNLSRVAAWLDRTPRAQTRMSPLVTCFAA